MKQQALPNTICNWGYKVWSVELLGTSEQCYLRGPSRHTHPPRAGTALGECAGTISEGEAELLCWQEVCELQRAAHMKTAVLITVCIQFINHQERRNVLLFIYCCESRRIEYVFQKVFRVNETVSTFQNNSPRLL